MKLSHWILGLTMLLVACSPAASSPTPLPAAASPTIAAAPLTATPASSIPTPAPTRTVAEVLQRSPSFSQFAAALQRTGVWDEVADGRRRFTIFAPVNAALAALPADRAERLDREALLASVLRYHLVMGDVSDEALLRTTGLETVLGEPLGVIGDLYDTPLVGTARVVGSGTTASNGMVYAVDTVLWPMAAQTLAEVVGGDSRLAELQRAIQTAGLSDVLAEPGPYTLFAPTNDAFAALTPEQRQRLENPDNLKQVMLYHVAQGAITSADAANLDWSQSLLDQPLLCRVIGNLWTVNDAQVLVKDIRVANGMLHLVNEVLFPPIALGQ